MTLFHSRFGCTFFQLFRNALMLILFNFLRCIVVFVLMWLPAAIFLVNAALFIQITPLWFMGYYAICAYFIVWVFRVPFAVLVKNYNETHEIDEPKTEENPEIEEPEE